MQGDLITNNWIIAENINKYLNALYKEDHKAKFNHTINTNQYGQAINLWIGRHNLKTNMEGIYLYN